MLRAGALALALACCACFIPTQRIPGVMKPKVEPLPAGTLESFPPGPEEVLVVRHADPAQVRPAGLASSFPLPFYDKQARVNSGSWVFCGAGGRLEVLWPNDGASVMLSGMGTGVIGSESRGEPIFYVRQVERASMFLLPGDSVELLGGAILSVPADEDEARRRVGPFVVENRGREILRVLNEAKGSGRIEFREARFDFDPGHVVDLPLLELGGKPIQVDPSFRTLPGGVEVGGEVVVLPDPAGTRVRAAGDHEIRGFGVRIRLGQGEEATFLNLGPVPAGPPGQPGPPVEAPPPGPDAD